MGNELNQECQGAVSLVIGLDAGGTRTRAVLADAADGRPLGEGAAGPGNALTVPGPQLTEHLAEALARAVPEPCRGRVVAVAGGFAGATDAAADEPGRRNALAALTAALRRLGIDAGPPVISSDIEAAFASAPGAPADGLALVAGTGAVAMRITARRGTATVDGDGWLLGDDGSGFWIGRAAVRAALRMADGRGAATVLAATVGRELGVPEEVLPGGPSPAAPGGVVVRPLGEEAPHGAGGPGVSPRTGAPHGTGGPGASPGTGAPHGAVGPGDSPGTGGPHGTAGPGASPGTGAPHGAVGSGDSPGTGGPHGTGGPGGSPGTGAPHGAVGSGDSPGTGGPHGTAGPGGSHGVTGYGLPPGAGGLRDSPGTGGPGGPHGVTGYGLPPRAGGPGDSPGVAGYGIPPHTGTPWPRAHREAYRRHLLPAVMAEPPVRLARLAPLVAGAAGDAVALAILDEAADHLTETVRALEPRPGERVVATGGLLGPDGPLTSRLEARLHALGLTLDWVPDGCRGAVALARLAHRDRT
ncbi:BadF/BadG/BcrA/BcrD ATPase family protein [Streptomyces sp. Go-475]|uniref:BadF/BadG/BcrA/BcrD ATPase family protein n=1 Tax=Streptomyces sp. Go-475 TaxID=2072505 RepID=UPI000DF09FDE|nr:BadF/BadG/BcrA/BcrD ATPase family protein [Streptomyces sp. Go-475]AXE89371.1 BadF/BadG/BcrA/BcrD ATPase family protein [Streptomyces sp. Go-475]